jgi:4-amino-4-deoxy-L-arabinose transferase-like glycosyltransferase
LLLFIRSRRQTRILDIRASWGTGATSSVSVEFRDGRRSIVLLQVRAAAFLADIERLTQGARMSPTLPPPRWSEIAAVAAIAALPLFFRVHIPPVYSWDEARVAINALEMMHTAHPFIVTFHGEADLWNPKPPLAIWLTALSMRLFGVSELALRLPAVLAAVGTVLAVYLFTRRVSASRPTSLLAVLILLGTGGYYQIHVARTADYDSLLVLFTTLATFRFFFATEGLEAADHKRKDLYAAAAFITGGLYTKGVAGLLMMPGYLLYVVCSGKLRALVRRRALWISAACVLSSALLFLVARELSQPGFAQAMWQLDVAGRFGTPSTGRAAGGLYYLSGLLWPWPLFWLSPPSGISTALSAFPWSWLLPLAALFGISSSRPLMAHASGYLLCCLIGFLAVISAAEVRAPWYVAPAYPVIAALAAFGLDELGRRLRDRRSELLRFAGIATLPAAIALGVASVAANLAKTERGLTGAHYSAGRQLHYFLRSFASEHPPFPRVRIVRVMNVETPAVVDGKIVGTERYDGPIEFYVRELRRRIPDVQVVGSGYVARPDDVIIGCGKAVRAAYPTLAVLKEEGLCFALGNPSPDAQ